MHVVVGKSAHNWPLPAMNKNATTSRVAFSLTHKAESHIVRVRKRKFLSPAISSGEPIRPTGIVYRGQCIPRLLICGCNIHLFRVFGKWNFQEGTLHHGPLVCWVNRQADPPRMNRGTPKEWKFLLKSHRIISSSIHADELPHKMFPEHFIP